MTDTSGIICDPETGICELPGNKVDKNSQPKSTGSSKVKLIYFTDPICSSCWGIEPQLRKLKLTFGDQIEWEYHMGGLLPDWSYNSGGISKPSDVASHWDEVSQHYQMPIDGDLWLEDPLESSYPPSIAFKAAELQNEEKAHAFLRVMRELVFVKKQNIAKWEVTAKAASRVGLDTVQLKLDMTANGKSAFENDLNLSKAMGVRGFPTIFVVDLEGNSKVVYGSRLFQVYVDEILKVDSSLMSHDYKKQENLFAIYPTLTTREFAELSGMTFEEGEKALVSMEEMNKVTSYRIKNGVLWSLNK